MKTCKTLQTPDRTMTMMHDLYDNKSIRTDANLSNKMHNITVVRSLTGNTMTWLLETFGII